MNVNPSAARSIDVSCYRFRASLLRRSTTAVLHRQSAAEAASDAVTVSSFAYFWWTERHTAATTATHNIHHLCARQRAPPDGMANNAAHTNNIHSDNSSWDIFCERSGKENEELSVISMEISQIPPIYVYHQFDRKRKNFITSWQLFGGVSTWNCYASLDLN